MKKRVLAALLLLVLAFSLMTTAAAANTNTYTIDELNMTVDVPANWIGFTRTDIDEDISLEYWDMTAEEMEQYYIDNDAYFDTFNADCTYEIYLYALADEDLIDYNDYTEEELAAEGESILEYNRANGYACTDYSIYKQADTTFIVVDSSDSDGTYYRDFNTVYNGQYITFVLISFNGEIEEGYAQIYQNVIDSIVFAGAQASSSQSSSSQSSSQSSSASSSSTQPSSARTSQGQAYPAQMPPTETSEQETAQPNNSSGSTDTTQVFVIILSIVVLVLVLFGMVVAAIIRRENKR